MRSRRPGVSRLPVLLAAGCLASAGAVAIGSPGSTAGAVSMVPAAWAPAPIAAGAASAPDDRQGAAMAYDAAIGGAVMFGGATDDSSAPSANDTWIWNGSGWKRQHPATSPSARTSATMAYDAASGQLLVFGGGNGADDGSLSTQSDTWIFTGTTWRQLHPAVTPLPRLAASMAYDPGNATVVLFGGADAGGDSLGDTWVWNGQTWRQQTPVHSPGRRVNATMASDPANGDVVLFGGVDGLGNALADTWLWNGSDWTQLAPATSPPARSAAVADFDASLGQVVMTGGSDGSSSDAAASSPASSAAPASSSAAGSGGLLSDTWTFDGTAWKQLAVAGSAPAVAGAGGAFEVASSQFVVFGGSAAEGAPAISSTWLLTGGGIVATRLAGADRLGTAVAVSQSEIPAGKAKAVVLVRSDVITDALTGGPLAAFEGGPLLLTDPHTIAPSVRAEIKRALPGGGPVYLLGGPSALSPALAASLTAAGYQVHRIFGADRYATAVAIARAMGDPQTVFEAAAGDVADAVSGVPAAISAGAPILLTDGSKPASATTAYLGAEMPAHRFALGGAAAAADPAATPVVGIDRYATSALIAGTFFAAPSTIGIAGGLTGTDALAAGVDMGRLGGPLLLVPPSGALPPAVGSYLASSKAAVTSLWVFGGPAAVSQQMVDLVGVALR